MIVENVVKKFGGKTVLENISPSIEKGIVYSLLGPNGAGKTTLLSIIGWYTIEAIGMMFLYGGFNWGR